MGKRTKRFEDGGEIVVTGSRPSGGISPTNPMGAIPVSYVMPPRNTAQRVAPISAPSDGGGVAGPSVGSFRTAAGKMYGVENIPVGTGTLSVGATPRRGGGVGATYSMPFKKGGKVKKMAKGGSTASKRADGCATKGKTKGRFV